MMRPGRIRSSLYQSALITIEEVSYVEAIRIIKRTSAQSLEPGAGIQGWRKPE